MGFGKQSTQKPDTRVQFGKVYDPFFSIETFTSGATSGPRREIKIHCDCDKLCLNLIYRKLANFLRGRWSRSRVQRL